MIPPTGAPITTKGKNQHMSHTLEKNQAFGELPHVVMPMAMLRCFVKARLTSARPGM